MRARNCNVGMHVYMKSPDGCYETKFLCHVFVFASFSFLFQPVSKTRKGQRRHVKSLRVHEESFSMLLGEMKILQAMSMFLPSFSFVFP